MRIFNYLVLKYIVICILNTKHFLGTIPVREGIEFLNLIEDIVHNILYTEWLEVINKYIYDVYLCIAE